jgi:hypothetical protein
LEERRVEANQLFVNNELLLGRCLGHDDADELSGFARGRRDEYKGETRL